ncbi:hypothetical protein D3C87_1561120 [compost metagenome]
MDEGAAVDTADIDRLDAALGQGIQHLPDIKRQLQRAGKQVHRSCRHDAQRHAGLPGDASGGRDGAVATAGDQALHTVFASRLFQGRHDVLARNDIALQVMARAIEGVGRLGAVALHVGGFERAAVLVENSLEFHACDSPSRSVETFREATALVNAPARKLFPALKDR